MSSFGQRVLDGLGPAFRARAGNTTLLPVDDPDGDGLFEPGPAQPDTNGLYAVPQGLAPDGTVIGLYDVPQSELLTALVEGLVSGLVAADDLMQPTDRGWAAAFNLPTTPDPTWLGQATGTAVPNGLSLDDQRTFVTERPAWRRGTPAALVAAVRATLTGLQRVTLDERDGSPWRLTVSTYAAETPDPAATLAAALTQKPVGIVLTHQVLAGATYAHMTAVHGPTYAAEAAAFPTYADAIAHLPEEP